MLRNDASLGQASMRCRSSISFSTGLAAPAKIGGGVLKRKSTSPVPYVYRVRIRSPPSARNLFLGETLRGCALRFARLGDGGHARADYGLSWREPRAVEPRMDTNGRELKRIRMGNGLRGFEVELTAPFYFQLAFFGGPSVDFP